MPQEKSDPKKISFTGDGQGHFKTFYNLPYAKELYDLTKNKRLDYEDISKSDRKKIIPIFEARHKSTISIIKQIVKEKGIRQILDMGSGLSAIGLIMTDLYPDLIFVEVDLPEMIEKKKQAVEEINKRLGKPSPNLYFYSGDVRDLEQLKKAITRFNPNKPTIVIMEGLFSYYDDSDKALILNNAKKIQGPDGYIITPDPSTNNIRRAIFRTIGTEESSKQIAQKTGRSFEKHGFKSEEHADELFKKLGFSIKKFKPTDYTLESFKNLNIDKETEKILREDIKKNAKVWVLEISDDN